MRRGGGGACKSLQDSPLGATLLAVVKTLLAIVEALLEPWQVLKLDNGRAICPHGFEAGSDTFHQHFLSLNKHLKDKKCENMTQQLEIKGWFKNYSFNLISKQLLHLSHKAMISDNQYAAYDLPIIK